MIEIHVLSQASVVIDGQEVPVPPEAQGQLPRFIAHTAAQRLLTQGQSAPMSVRQPDGSVLNLQLHANGTTSQPAQEAPAWSQPQAPAPVSAPAPSAPDAGQATTRREARASFIQSAAERERAQEGWRGVLSRSGLNVSPSAAEVEKRQDERSVSQHWPGPRTIAIVNGKGGANKTPTTAMLAAVFARFGGSGVLVWDNNETRGSLGWRTEQGPHEATVQHLLPATDRLLSPEAQSADLSYFVHHQTADKYDVLRSNPQLLAADQRIDARDFDKLHGVASKYFRLIFIDSGNDESAERWLRMIDHTTQLVVATVEKQDHAEAGALLLEALAQRSEHGARLAKNAVVVVSQSEKAARTATQHIAGEYQRQGLARAAVTIPYDDALHEGPLRFAELEQRTQRAWLRAAASVAAGL